MGERRRTVAFRGIVSFLVFYFLCVGFSSTSYIGNVCVADSNYVVVDDMESYNDSSNLIWYTWIDGCSYTWNRWGSCIETAVDPCEVVHGGSQSMRYDYETYGGFDGDNFAQILRSNDPPEDWSSNGEKVLVIWFRGKADNETTSMWVHLDYVMESVFYGDYGEDPEDIRKEEWIEWNINLVDLVEVEGNLASVGTIVIGFGDKIGDVPDFNSGTVYFDDIRLYPARCVERFAPVGDFSGDCAADWQDLGIIGEEWLTTGISSSSTMDYDVNDYNDCQSKGPSPSDGQTGVQSWTSEVMLCWEEGSEIGLRGRHILYFGDDFDDVNDATPSDDEFVQYQTPGYDCHTIGNLPLWETFYWRVDEFGEDATTCKGKVWSFTTGCELPASDMNLDCFVNFKDFAGLTAAWLDEVRLWPVE